MLEEILKNLIWAFHDLSTTAQMGENVWMYSQLEFLSQNKKEQKKESEIKGKMAKSMFDWLTNFGTICKVLYDGKNHLRIIVNKMDDYGYFSKLFHKTNCSAVFSAFYFEYVWVLFWFCQTFKSTQQQPFVMFFAQF